MVCMNVVHVALSQRLLCGIVICSSVVSCVHVCFRIGCLYMCVETVDNACAIADTLLNGVRARLWSLHGCFCAIGERVVDMTRAGDDTMCTHSM